MKTHRKIIPIVALALALPALAPASVPASSILSGYGGPGQGTQAILGSTLLNGPSSGAGGGPQGGSSTPATTIGAGSSGGSTGGGGGGSGSRARGGSGAARPGAQTPGSQPGGAGVPVSTLAISRASAGGSGVLGLSDTAFLVVLLALGALVFTGLLTRGLAKMGGTRGHAGS
jgi:hypothetical protein